MRTIKLKSIGIGRYDDVSPFMITGSRLELKIDLPQLNGEFYFVGANNGEVIKKSIPRGGAIALENLTAGELNAEVKHYLKGEIIKVYKVEPLLIKEVDGTLSAMPEIEALCIRIRDLESQLGGLVKAVGDETERLEKALVGLKEKNCEILRTQLALVRFALEDFKQNVYLGGGTEEEFAEKYGFDSQTINLLKGDKEDDEN